MWRKSSVPEKKIPIAPVVPTLLSKLESLRASKEHEIKLMQESLRKLDEGISLLKWRPEAEAIIESLRRYV